MFRLTPTVRTLLIINVLVFFLQSQFGAQVDVLGALYPFSSIYFKPWQFVTYMFMHSGFGHLLSNMLGLVFIGASLEDVWGPKRFLTYWLICGIGAGVLYQGVRTYEIQQMNADRIEFRENPSGVAFVDFFSQHFPAYEQSAKSMGVSLDRNPGNASMIDQAADAIDDAYQSLLASPNAGMLGASGALFGVLFAFGFLFPQQTLIIFPIPIPIKAWLFVFLYTAYELYSGLHRTPGDNVAHFAHLGGMLIGFIVLKIWQRNGTHFG
ncbi:rhomboid family intramembrane serine protease [Hymenobacter tibetensis]|uniref:Rhomboid family intramembrane serine protease n=1 Tax=Hymenobacter tibetensis TaxID=497967 RepID=A0ABY4D0L8_9BACT|nr:rhomboid family intramembrane serine protease [Hymenobacter tibetensis]UOG76045.1 rhomboid family intramembrane serine protease [Hymenobacter tibetensis]